MNEQTTTELSRRAFLGKTAGGLGGVALSCLLRQDAVAGPLLPHFAPKAKRVIYLFMSGGPSQVDTFDSKPLLNRLDGKMMPASIIKNHQFAMIKTKNPTVKGSPWKFQKHGQSGIEISELFPHLAKQADRLCVINGMYADVPSHPECFLQLHTGSFQFVRPSVRAWALYGLGTSNENLPGFIVLTSKGGGQGQPIAARQWSSGFLPGRHQGVHLKSQGEPVHYVSSPDGPDLVGQRRLVDAVARLNAAENERNPDPEIETRLAQYEMAYKMQASVPELADVSTEPQHVLDSYGPDVMRRGSFAQNCLLARRLAEKGVRFVQLMHAGWDQHGNLPTQLAVQCRDTDQPSAALVKDLKQRGLLDETLVIWGGEFGRTSFCQGDINNKKAHGRDHHPRNFCLWMAGGGIKGGANYGKSDDFSYNVAEKPVHVHDLQATTLHLLGIEHEKLTYKFQGRDFRLTDVHGKVVKEILA